MKALECKIPPPIVAFLAAAMMWGIAKVAPAVEIDAGLRFALVALLATIGGIFAFSGFYAFGRAKTTISPINIEEASALVTTGVYRTTRNPMYLGLLMLLLAFAACSPSRSSSPGFKSSPKSARFQRNSATLIALIKRTFAAGSDARDEGGHDPKL